METVRVLAVRKEPAFARPGEPVEMSMLRHDGGRDESRDIQLAWIAGCHNPPGDLFFACFEQLGDLDLSGGDDPRVGVGDRFTLTPPADIISSRPPPPDPNQPPYGASFVFFAACAGSLRPVEAAGDQIPIGCFDGEGQRLGADDFMIGYTTAFAYDDLENRLPAVTGFRLGGREVSIDCVDQQCLDATDGASDDATDEEPIDCDGGDARCIDACEMDEDECPEIALEAIVDPSSVEIDPVATDAKGTETFEHQWINYFAERGRVAAETRIHLDADTGPRSDVASRYFAPKQPGTIRMWAALHDSRGGTSWVRFRVVVR